jgi:hypothetical protein
MSYNLSSIPNEKDGPVGTPALNAPQQEDLESLSLVFPMVMAEGREMIMKYRSAGENLPCAHLTRRHAMDKMVRWKFFSSAFALRI